AVPRHPPAAGGTAADRLPGDGGAAGRRQHVRWDGLSQFGPSLPRSDLRPHDYGAAGQLPVRLPAPRQRPSEHGRDDHRSVAPRSIRYLLCNVRKRSRGHAPGSARDRETLPMRKVMMLAAAVLLLSVAAVADGAISGARQHAHAARRQGQVREFTLTAEPLKWEIQPGLVVDGWGYNGQIPGPTLRVTEGDLVRVHLINHLPEATTIHWHGIDVPSDMDGVPGLSQDPV